jgi:hypothetical protein
LEIVPKTTFSTAHVTSMATTTHRAACPAGKRIVSGGFNLASTLARALTVLTSYPEAATQSWVVELKNHTSMNLGFVDVTVYATCVAAN